MNYGHPPTFVIFVFRLLSYVCIFISMYCHQPHQFYTLSKSEHNLKDPWNRPSLKLSFPSRVYQAQYKRALS